MRREANILPWNVFGETFASPDNVPPGVDDVYTDLDTTRLERLPDDLAFRQFFMRIEQARRVPVQEMADGQQRLLITGDPGSGKTTFIKRLAYLLARAGLSEEPDQVLAKLEPWSHGPLLPVFVELRNVAAFAAERKVTTGSTRLFAQYLEYSLGQWGITSAWETVREYLHGGDVSALLLLDGLDEVATSQRRLLVDMVNAMAADEVLGRQRFIVTCRPYAYYDMPAEYRLRTFEEVTLHHFSPEQVDRFVTNWYERLQKAEKPLFSPEEIGERLKDLRGALRRRDHRSLAKRPILLTMMVQLHTFQGRLPGDRVQLYKESVDLLLTRWNTKTHSQPALRDYLGLADLKEGDLEKALFNIAFRAQSSEVGNGSATGEDEEEPSADIAESELRDWVRPYLGGSDQHAAKFVEYVRERAGLLVRHKTSAYTFPHRSIQEFLAACHLVRADDLDYKEMAPQLVAGDPTRWREVFVLAAGYASRYTKTSDAVAAVAALCPRDCPAPEKTQQLDPAVWTKAQIAADALLEIGQSGVRRTGLGPTQWERTQDWLAALMGQKQTPDAKTRVVAGRTLAKLEDCRGGILDPRAMEFCLVPAGPFFMGSRDDPLAWDDEKPYAEIFDVPYRYWISRFPVTNAQFGVFVKGKGYENPAYWPEAIGHELWKDGQIKRRYGVYDEQRKLERVESEWAWAPVRYDEPYGISNHPVVGISWYEALAFTRWLEAQLPDGWRVTLPNEPEWEKAARGGQRVPRKPEILSFGEITGFDGSPAEEPNRLPARRYPWGDEIVANVVNYYATEIGATSAVGCFAGGASPYGVEEASGNVWEWTRSLWGKKVETPDFRYPYDAGDGREYLMAGTDVLRVVRGGSFDFYELYVRCAVRDGRDPDVRLNSLGVRVVVLPPSTSGL